MKYLNSRNKIIKNFHKVTGFPFSICRRILKLNCWKTDKENMFNGFSKPNVTTTIREAAKSHDLKIGYIEIDNPDIDNILGLFTLWIPSFDTPISVVIDENSREYSLSDLYDVLLCIQRFFKEFDIESGDVEADTVDVYLGGNVIILKCKSVDDIEYEYWTRKPYEDGLAYLISSFAKELRVLNGPADNDYLDLEHILDLSFTTYYSKRSPFKDITYHDWVFEFDPHRYIYIFRLRYKGDLQIQFGIHDSKVLIEYFTNEYGDDFMDRITKIVKQKISEYIE